MERALRWGIVGPGRIARGVARDVPLVPGAELAAVASRSADRAAAFAADHKIARSYGSYRELIDDPEVDALYIATPHPQHHAIALAGIAAGKALLVEKTFTATVAGCEEIITAAERAGVFVMEAMWTRFQPAVVDAMSLIADGAIGEVRQVEADLGVDKPFDPTDRLFDPAQGGGALLDLGVYPISLAQYVLGTPDRVHVSGSRTATGVDGQVGVLLGYDDGRAAVLSASIEFPLPGAARITGTGGWIELHPRFHHPHGFTLRRRGRDPERFDRPPTGTGYAHELIEVTDAVRAGRTGSPIMPLTDTLAVQRILGEACEQLGVHHREDTDVAV